MGSSGSSNMTNMTNSTMWKMMPGSDFDPVWAQEWMAKNWHQSFYLALVYLLMLPIGSRYMRNRPPVRLNRPLVIWNALLTVFSVTGTYYTLPEFVDHIRKFGYFDSYCVVDDYYRKLPSAFWVWAFTLSKAPELGDTVFLILRKRPVIFLHLFHHSTVVVWCWYSFPFQSAPPRWGVALNYAVHSVMYAYYTARAARVRIPPAMSQAITSLQLIQFLVCVPLNLMAFYKTALPAMGWSLKRDDSIVSYLSNTETCDTTFGLVMWQFFLYGAYFFLFAWYFYKTYIERKEPKSALKED